VRASRKFSKFAEWVAHATGRPVSFVACLCLVLVWAASGPLFHFSDTWQLVINTSTTIVTFLMVFLIQNTQNRDGAAVQTKLDELIRASAAHNRFIGIEHLTEEEVNELRKREETRGHAERLTHARKAADLAAESANERAAEAAAVATGAAPKGRPRRSARK
jgi:low affinity Fe/Cu permease